MDRHLDFTKKKHLDESLCILETSEIKFLSGMSRGTFGKEEKVNLKREWLV